MFLTEKTEENRQLEPFNGNISLVKVVQNDQQCYPECLETPSGVIIDREPPFLTFLTEKTEENRQFEWFYVNISVVKVGQNDL